MLCDPRHVPGLPWDAGTSKGSGVRKNPPWESSCEFLCLTTRCSFSRGKTRQHVIHMRAGCAPGAILVMSTAMVGMTELYIAVISQTTPTTPQTLCSRNTTNRCQPAQETALGALEAPQHRREHLRVQRRRNQSPETRLVVACLATWDMWYWAR